LDANASTNSPFSVAVVGAGPAGLYAAKELAAQGVNVTLFNRDIKPGGLAEYGIYPFKYKMKEGLRAQFRQILALKNVQYYGNISIGEKADLSLDDLRAMGFDALLITVGAQGTKWLGLPGEELSGVYHAKDLVYHYNSLPPYSERKFLYGQRAAVIGVGNVMLDITHYLLEEAGVAEIVAVARRGPAEVKFDKKELESVVHYLDMPSLNAELERMKPLMLALGQDPDALPATIQLVKERSATAKDIPNHFHIQFTASPKRIFGEGGRVGGLEIEETTLQLKENGETAARGTGKTSVLDVDMIIFAIGDAVDGDLGLPVVGIEFVKDRGPRFPQDGVSYEVFDPARQQTIPDVFVAGWARQASTGLVGVARRDGTNGSRALLAYLQTLPAHGEATMERIQSRLAQIQKPLVSRVHLAILEQAERDYAAAHSLEFFKYDNNADMLRAMGFGAVAD
jgi:ferredoxin--NADP+ reductase